MSRSSLVGSLFFAISFTTQTYARPLETMLSLITRREEKTGANAGSSHTNAIVGAVIAVVGILIAGIILYFFVIRPRMLARQRAPSAEHASASAAPQRPPHRRAASTDVLSGPGSRITPYRAGETERNGDFAQFENAQSRAATMRVAHRKPDGSWGFSTDSPKTYFSSGASSASLIGASPPVSPTSSTFTLAKPAKALYSPSAGKSQLSLNSYFHDVPMGPVPPPYEPSEAHSRVTTTTTSL